jgi:flagellar basal-body rod modification protein FlgD
MASPISTINHATPATAGDTSSSTLSRVPVQTLGQSDFLKLLATQMSSQDPMNPQKDTDFIAQMAQFSSLQTSQNINAGVAGLQSQQNFTQAYSLLGQTVSLQTDSKDSKTTVQGVVQTVKIEAGKPKLVVNGQSYDLSQVVSVTPPSTKTSGPKTL